MKIVPDKNENKILKALTMLLLALGPILSWYKIPFPLSLGSTLILGISLIGIGIKGLSFRILPVSFYGVFFYVSLMWTLNNGVKFWTLLPPGGVLFFNFVLGLIGCILFFDIGYLKKFMKLVVCISISLFWIQVFFLKILDTTICFVPNITGSFTYEDLSYAELQARHLANKYPCSIFLEKSYMAYYLISYLPLELFGASKQNKFLSFPVVVIIITLLALRSGSGLIGLAFFLLIKAYKTFLRNSSLPQKIFTVIIGIPLLLGVLFFYKSTTSGNEIIERSAELKTEGTSGYTRIIQGYIIYDDLPFINKIFGMPREEVIDFSEKTYNTDDRLYASGIQYILITLGILGMLFYLIFYIEIYRKSTEIGKMSLVALLVIALLESCYLNLNMLLLTVIPCAQLYYGHHQRKSSSFLI